MAASGYIEFRIRVNICFAQISTKGITLKAFQENPTNSFCEIMASTFKCQNLRWPLVTI